MLALVCVVCGQEDPLAALGKSDTSNIFAKSPETRVYLMINAPNNPVQWKMLRRFPGPLQSQLVTTEREMTCRHHRHFCHQFRMDFATCYWSNSPPPAISLDIMFTLTPYEHLPSKYKLLIRCKNVYHMTALINHKNQQSSSEQNIIFSAQNIPGVPGEDYPIFVLPPETQFDCNEQIEGEKLHDIWVLISIFSLSRVLCGHWCRLSGFPHLRSWRQQLSAQVQLPLPQRHPVQPAVLHLRLVVQRGLLPGPHLLLPQRRHRRSRRRGQRQQGGQEPGRGRDHRPQEHRGLQWTAGQTGEGPQVQRITAITR